MNIEWNVLALGKTFITDMGDCMQGYGNNLCRYAVWVPYPEESSKHRIAQVGNDLEILKKKFNVEQNYVFCIKGGST